MSSNKIVILMGSKSDFTFARKIGMFIRKEGFKVKCKYAISSAHRTPRLLLDKLKAFESSTDDIVYITVAGLSDALSGVVAGFSTYPVISCPPDINKFGLTKVFSSVMMPTGVPVLLVSNPENAALSAVKIFAVTDHSLQEQVRKYLEKRVEQVIKDDKEIAAEKE